MLLFGHLGITVGVARLGTALSRASRRSSAISVPADDPGQTKGQSTSAWTGSVDYRLVLIGSLLPDIIDKSVWLGFVSNAWLSGRGYAHTLLFSLLLLVGGMVLFKYKKPWLVVLSLSSLGHLVLDQMWGRPVVLLWPLLGPMPKEPATGWWARILEALLSRPDVFIPEIIGVLVVSWLAYRVVKGKGIGRFFRTGAVR
jgi:hypothetical protein